MGFATGGFCHDTIDQAAAYDCGAKFPQVWGSGDSLVVVTCSGESGGVLSLSKSFDGSTGSPFTLAPSYSECVQSDWLTYTPFSLSAANGGALAGAICALWLAAWGYRMVRKTISDRDDE